MPAPPYKELPTIAPVGSIRNLDKAAYLSANPDVRASGLEALDHFSRYGLQEGRRQFVNAKEIGALRSKKLDAISFKREADSGSPKTGPLNFLSKETKASFEIPEFPPIAANDYNSEIIDLIRANPSQLFLDVGAGLRHTYYSNVINAEIWSSSSTDVVCIGEDLPFSSNQFDHVFCLAVLEHTKRPWIAVKEIIRVAKPGGLIRIDWPFLQPVHGYPHHFFNATPKGNISQFEEHCDILSCEVRAWQHPIFALRWILEEWQAGLPEQERIAFEGMKVSDVLGAPTLVQLGQPYCEKLSLNAQEIIAAGTTLIARKR
jgi:SAM-dependent methyltransferase